MLDDNAGLTRKVTALTSRDTIMNTQLLEMASKILDLIHATRNSENQIPQM